jgi:hypothetical protein
MGRGFKTNPRPKTPKEKTMKSFNYECLTISEVCNHNGLDYQDVMDELANSEISFGTNGDTLVQGSDLEDILGKQLNWGDYSKEIMVSLGS